MFPIPNISVSHVNIHFRYLSIRMFLFPTSQYRTIPCFYSQYLSIQCFYSQYPMFLFPIHVSQYPTISFPSIPCFYSTVSTMERSDRIVVNGL